MTRLRQRRLDLGLGQAAVAQATGLSRQALSALEAGRAQPSLASALTIARTLGSTVEALFGPERTAAGDVEPWLGFAPPDGRVRWSRIDGRLVVRAAGPDEEVDAVVRPAGGRRGDVAPLPGAADPDRMVWIAGCDPALPLLARAMERAAPHLQVQALAMTTGEARTALADGRVHVASLHGADDDAGSDRDLPYLSWREGFVLARGLEPERLTDGRLRWALRPPGATARVLLERNAPGAAAAPGLVVSGHWAVAEAIRSGQADAGVAVEAAAAAFGLRFIPLDEEQVHLRVNPGAQEVSDALVRALADDRLWSRLRVLAGYRRASA